MGTAADAVGGRVCQRRVGLLLATDSIATMGDERCYMELAVLLPAATEVATMGDGRRYMELAALLPMATGLATMGGWPCYHGRGRCYMELATLLPPTTGVATMGGWPCYHGRRALLHGARGVATGSHRGCYHGISVLLPSGTRAAASVTKLLLHQQCSRQVLQRLPLQTEEQRRCARMGEAERWRGGLLHRRPNSGRQRHDRVLRRRDHGALRRCSDRGPWAAVLSMHAAGVMQGRHCQFLPVGCVFLFGFCGEG
jgi:hypothetical protein